MQNNHKSTESDNGVSSIQFDTSQHPYVKPGKVEDAVTHKAQSTTPITCSLTPRLYEAYFCEAGPGGGGGQRSSGFNDFLFRSREA